MQVIPTDDYIKRITEQKTGEIVTRVQEFFLSDLYENGANIIYPQPNEFYFINYFSNGDGVLNFIIDNNSVLEVSAAQNNDSYIFCNGVTLTDVTSRSIELIGWKITTEYTGAILPTAGLVQYGETYKEGVFTDKMLLSDFEVVRSNGFAFNGSDNNFTTTDSYSDATKLYQHFKFKTSTDITNAQRFSYQDAIYGGATYRVSALIYSGKIFIYVNAANGAQNISLPISINTYYDYEIIYNQVEFYVILNGIRTDITSYLGGVILSSTDNIHFGYNPGSGQYLNVEIYNISYSVNNGALRNIPFSLGSGNKVYDVNSNTEYTISGTVNATNHILADIEHPYNLFNGFGKIADLEYTFDADLEGFTLSGVSGTQSLNWNSGSMNFISGGNSGNSYSPKIVKTSTDALIEGLEYTLSFDYLVNSGAFRITSIWIGGYYKTVYAYMTGSSTYSYTFIASGTSSTISLATNGQSACNVLIDNFKIECTAKLPQSKLNTTQDVLGNTLTNPAITNTNGEVIGHNNAESGLKQKNNAKLILADFNEFWFISGVAQIKYFADLANNGNNIFCNIVDSEKDKRDLLLYSENKTDNEKIEIQKYFDENN